MLRRRKFSNWSTFADTCIYVYTKTGALQLLSSTLMFLLEQLYQIFRIMNSKTKISWLTLEKFPHSINYDSRHLYIATKLNNIIKIGWSLKKSLNWAEKNIKITFNSRMNRNSKKNGTTWILTCFPMGTDDKNEQLTVYNEEHVSKENPVLGYWINKRLWSFAIVRTNSRR